MDSAQPFSRYVKFSPHLYWHIVFPLMLLGLLGMFLYITYKYPAAADLARASTIVSAVRTASNAVSNAAAKVSANAAKAVGKPTP